MDRNTVIMAAESTINENETSQTTEDDVREQDNARAEIIAIAFPLDRTLDMRQQILQVLAERLNVSLRPPEHPLNRMRDTLYTDATTSLDLLRRNLQCFINKDIDTVIKKYLQKFFHPAVINIRGNLGGASVSQEVLRDLCTSMLDHAKQMYAAPLPTRQASNAAEPEQRNNENSSNKRNVQENGENNRKRGITFDLIKWEPSRVTSDTQFMLSTTASQVIGVRPVNNLVKYAPDEDDREWLATVVRLAAPVGTTLVFLEDVFEVFSNASFRSSSVTCELKAFKLPVFIQKKVRAYMTLIKSKFEYIRQSLEYRAKRRRDELISGQGPSTVSSTSPVDIPAFSENNATVNDSPAQSADVVNDETLAESASVATATDDN